MSFEEANKIAKQFMQKQNNDPVDDFQGLSPFQMHHLIHDPLHPDSILNIKELSVEQLERIPMFCQVRFLAQLIADSKGLKLTKSGFLPMKVVEAIYNQGYIREHFVEQGIQKRMREDEIPSVFIARILLQVMGMTKIRSGKLSLTKKAEKLLADGQLLLNTLLQDYLKEFNWGFMDGYEDDRVGQMAGAFSIYLVHKFGDKKRIDTFYAEKYIQAFPMLLDSPIPVYQEPVDYIGHIYIYRAIQQFMVYFGLIEYQRGKRYDDDSFVTKTALFDEFISFE